MMQRILAYLLMGLLLAGCQHKPAEKTTEPVAAPAATPVRVAAPTVQPPAPPKAPAMPARQLYEQFTATTDTVFHTAGRRYYLTLRVQLDTLQPLAYHTKRDTTHGYQGYYTFTIRDSLRRLVSKRTLRKQDFYQAVGGDLAVLSNTHLPTLLGYSAPLGGLVFSVNFGAPETDWLVDAALLLTLEGKVQQLVTDYVVGGPDVHATLSADRRTLLTVEKIFRSNGTPLPLARPGMELRGATLLGDSLAVVVYEPGTYKPAKPGYGPEFVATPAQKRQPNAFVLNTHTGQTLARFRYYGFSEELGFTVPGEYLPATRTGYFLDDKKGLYLVSAALPQYVALRPLKSLARFEPPAQPGEKQLSLAGSTRHYQVYIDTLNPARIRARYEQTGLE